MKKATKKWILLATIELLSYHGGPNLTIKNISSRAGCNASAINYYFGSKENLLQDACEVITKQSNLELVLQKRRLIL